MFKFVNLIVCFILINNYGFSEKLSSLYIDDADFERVSSHKYQNEKKIDNNELFLKQLADQDLLESASDNQPKISSSNDQNKRFETWFDIGGGDRLNLTLPSNKLESNLKNQVKQKDKSVKKKWLVISSSTLSDTIDDNLYTDNVSKISAAKNKKEYKKQKKSRKSKAANLDFKLKEFNEDKTDYVKKKIANTTIYTIDKKDDDLKFKLNDAISLKNYESNSSAIPISARNNETLARKSQLTSSSSKIHKKIMFAASMLPLMKGLTQTHVAVLPTAIAQPAQVVMPAPMPVPVPVSVNLPQVHIVQPRPIYQQVIARPPPQQIITQPIIQQPIIQQPIIHRKIITQPIIHQPVVQQPIIISRPVQMRTIKAQPQIYQTLHMPAEQTNCNQQVADVVDDSNEESIQDVVDDDTSQPTQTDDDNSYAQDSWGNPPAQQNQIRIVPQQIAQPQNSQDSWGTSHVQNQKVYTYQTASVPKRTRTVHTHTRMIPSTQYHHVYTQTSYTPEHRHIITETEHNIKPVMSLVSTSQRKIMSRPVYTVKTIQQPVAIQNPTYVSNDNQNSWSN